MIKDGKIHPRYPNLPSINPDDTSQLELTITMITRAILANRSFDHNIEETRSNQSMITETFIIENQNKVLTLVLYFKCKQPLLFKI